MTTVMDLSDALAGAVERAARSVFAVPGRRRLPSTGVQWRAGLVVTANHTVEPDHEITLSGPDGRTLAARAAGRDPGLDIAVLRADDDGIPTAEIDEGAVRIGHLVVALGAGMGPIRRAAMDHLPRHLASAAPSAGETAGRR